MRCLFAALYLISLALPAVASDQDEQEITRAATEIRALSKKIQQGEAAAFAASMPDERVRELLLSDQDSAKEIIRKARERNKAEDEAKDTLREFNEYRGSTTWARVGRFMSEGLFVKARATLTNNDGDQSSAAGTRIDLDKTFFDGGFDIGYFERPLLRDVWLRSSNERAKAHAEWKAGGSKRDLSNFAHWGLIEAVKFDLHGGWGTVINDPQGDDNSTTDKRGVYKVGVSWKIPISTFDDSNPFD